MSQRVTKALHTRRKDATEGWVFPSDSVTGHITTVAKAFEDARAKAGLSKDIVLYSARHTFATKILGATGNLSLVMRTMGHTNAQTAMIYQHPSLETVRMVVNENHGPMLSRHNPRHTVVM